MKLGDFKQNTKELMVRRIMKKHGIEKTSVDDYEITEKTVIYPFFKAFSISEDLNESFESFKNFNKRLDEFLTGLKGFGEVSPVAYDTCVSGYEFGLRVVIFGEVTKKTERNLPKKSK